MSTVEAKVALVEGTVLKGKAHTDHEVRIDYIPPLGGDNGFMPMELLLISLAGCSLHTILFILGKMGKKVEKFEVSATGDRSDDHPTVYRSIDLHYKLAGEGLDEKSVQIAIKSAEDNYCPVSAMLKPGVELTSKFSIG